jgi:hypothetical protein
MACNDRRETSMLTDQLASHFMTVALGHVRREYPNKLEHVLSGPEDMATPRALHPIFHGSFDWHSCVHAYWMLARLLGRFPLLPEAEQVRALLTTMITPDNVAVELAYLSRSQSRGFERPYGWAWLLMLAAELHRQNHAAAGILQPLADAFGRRFIDHLPKATYPVRSGVHSNTAFAVALAIEYARECRDDAVATKLIDAARHWYNDDADYRGWEPGGEDFLSPCLVEAECMRRILPAAEFSVWFARFLPRLDQQKPEALFRPVTVSDRSDGRIAHLDGLNLSRAWCWGNLAGSLSGPDPRRAIMFDAATRHLEASLPYIAGHYMGEHWLATFALLALEAVPPEGA